MKKLTTKFVHETGKRAVYLEGTLIGHIYETCTKMHRGRYYGTYKTFMPTEEKALGAKGETVAKPIERPKNNSEKKRDGNHERTTL